MARCTQLLSVNLAGIQQWTGPFDVGIAGRRRGQRQEPTDSLVSGDKQLCTFEQGVPSRFLMSELAELSQIGDQFHRVESPY
jgi:hypothetical protein